MDVERRCLMQLSLDLEEESLLRCLAAAEGMALATLAHEVLLEGLRGLIEEYGGLDALPTPDDDSQGPWYAEGPYPEDRLRDPPSSTATPFTGSGTTPSPGTPHE